MFWTIVLAILFVTVGIPLIIVVFLALLGFVVFIMDVLVDIVWKFKK